MTRSSAGTSFESRATGANPMGPKSTEARLNIPLGEAGPSKLERLALRRLPRVARGRRPTQQHCRMAHSLRSPFIYPESARSFLAVWIERRGSQQARASSVKWPLALVQRDPSPRLLESHHQTIVARLFRLKPTRSALLRRRAAQGLGGACEHVARAQKKDRCSWLHRSSARTPRETFEAARILCAVVPFAISLLTRCDLVEDAAVGKVLLLHLRPAAQVFLHLDRLDLGKLG